MKIIIISDTHGHYDEAIRAIKSEQKVDAIIHAGDMAFDCREIENEFRNTDFYYVLGNNDFTNSIPHEIDIKLGGKRIYITHGHRLGVKYSMEKLHDKAREGFDLIVFGHTHKAYTEYFGASTIINPGCMCGFSPSYAICTIENGKLDTAIKKFIG